MILLPIGHERTTVRRLPWVTMGLIAICVAAFVLTGRFHLVPKEDISLMKNVPRAIKWYLEHPYLELDPEFERIFLSDFEEKELREMLGVSKPYPRPDSRRTLELLQEQLDTVTARAVEAYREHPLLQWGLIPKRISAVALFTHMFLHAGWLHLLGNLLILFLAGPFIEDVWGRPLYLAFYLVAGLLAGLIHVGANPDSPAPLVGASGAIAAVMGAFLVRYITTRIKFFYIILFIRGTFTAPAWLMLPLWFVHQLSLGMLTSEMNVQSGVAHWAHVGGFVVGVGVAWAMRSMEIEERFIHPAIDGKISLRVEGNEAVDQALAARVEGDSEKAFRMLCQAVKKYPGNQDAAATLWDVAGEVGRTKEAAPLMLRSIQHQLRSGQTEQALSQWVEVQERVPEVKGDPRLLVRLAKAMIDDHRGRDAIVTLRIALLSGGSSLDPTTALKIARTARELDDPNIARAAAQLVLGRPDTDPQIRNQAARLVEELAPASAQGSAAAGFST